MITTFTNFATSANLKNPLDYVGKQKKTCSVPKSEDSALGGDASESAVTSIANSFNLVTNIYKTELTTADVAFGSRYSKYKLITVQTLSLDLQSDPNTDTLTEKIIRGKRSGALMQITEFVNAPGTTILLVIYNFLKILKWASVQSMVTL